MSDKLIIQTRGQKAAIAKNNDAEAVVEEKKPGTKKAEAVASSSSSDYSSISSDESNNTRCVSGSFSFGPPPPKPPEVDENRIFMDEFEYNNQKYKINIPKKVPTLLNEANRLSPLLIDHIAKGMDDQIVTRRRYTKTGAKTVKARSTIAPKLLKQMKKDLEEDGGNVIYTWMFIAEKKKI